MGLINDKVYLEKNYLKWKQMFRDEKKLLKKIFHNNDLVIEHVGSTSVPGLIAKPIVDILVGVLKLNDLDEYICELEKYYKIKYNLDEILLIKEDSKETFFLIHVIDINSNRYKNMIKFRDILINNPNILNEYAKLKIDLQRKYADNRERYTEEKSKFIKEVLM